MNVVKIIRTNKLRMGAFLFVAAIGILTTMQQLQNQQDTRQSAAADVGIRIVAPSQVQIGGKTEAIVVIENRMAKRISGFDVTVNYDPRKFDYLQAYTLPPFNAIKVTPDKTHGRVRITGIVGSNSTTDKVLPGTSTYKAASVMLVAKGTSNTSTSVGFVNADITAIGETNNVTGYMTPAKILISQSSPTSPTPTWQPSPPATSVPLPTSNISPTPSSRQGVVNGSTTPAAQTIRILNSAGRIITQSTSGKISQTLNAGSYYASFAYTNRSDPSRRIPRTTRFTVTARKTTIIIGDFKTGQVSITTR